MKKKRIIVFFIGVFLITIIILIYGTIRNNNNNPEFHIISEKVKSLYDKNNGFAVLSAEDINEALKDFMPDIEINNAWVRPLGDNGYSIAVFGALKDNPKQGVVDVFELYNDKTSPKINQILAPSSDGGTLSVLNTYSPKDYNMEVMDKNNIVYLFNYYNGFTAYKHGIDSEDWQYW